MNPVQIMSTAPKAGTNAQAKRPNAARSAKTSANSSGFDDALQKSQAQQDAKAPVQSEAAPAEAQEANDAPAATSSTVEKTETAAVAEEAPTMGKTSGGESAKTGRDAKGSKAQDGKDAGADVASDANADNAAEVAAFAAVTVQDVTDAKAQVTTEDPMQAEALDVVAKLSGTPVEDLAQAFLDASAQKPAAQAALQTLLPQQAAQGTSQKTMLAMLSGQNVNANIAETSQEAPAPTLQAATEVPSATVQNLPGVSNPQLQDASLLGAKVRQGSLTTVQLPAKTQPLMQAAQQEPASAQVQALTQEQTLTQGAPQEPVAVQSQPLMQAAQQESVARQAQAMAQEAVPTQAQPWMQAAPQESVAAQAQPWMQAVQQEALAPQIQPLTQAAPQKPAATQVPLVMQATAQESIPSQAQPTAQAATQQFAEMPTLPMFSVQSAVAKTSSRLNALLDNASQKQAAPSTLSHLLDTELTGLADSSEASAGTFQLGQPIASQDGAASSFADFLQGKAASQPQMPELQQAGAGEKIVAQLPEEAAFDKAPTTTQEAPAQAGALPGFQQTLQNVSGAADAQAAQTAQQPQADYDIPQQIVDQARLIQRGQETEMVIHLKPEHLGDLTLRVSVGTDGAVNASFHSSNAEVRTIIENTLVQLKQDLNNQGIKVDNVGVYAGLADGGLPQDGGQQAAYQQQGSGQQQHSARESAEAFEDEQELAAALAAQKDSDAATDGVDYRV